MLVAAAIMGMSVYKTATLDEITASHFKAAMAAQGIGSDATAAARGLLLDALGPGGRQGGRSYKCLDFEISVNRPDRTECRAFEIVVSGLSDARVEGTLCPRPDGSWGESVTGTLTSIPLDQRWRDAILKKGAPLYRQPALQSYQNRFDWPDTKIQVGGYSYHEAQTFAAIRMPNGDGYYALKDDLQAAAPH